MTYNPSIPAINTRIDQTYNLVTSNFNLLNSIFGGTGAFPNNKDHIAWNFSTTSMQGLHQKTSLIQLSVAPTALATTGIVYTTNSPNVTTAPNNRTEPYYVYDSSASLGGFAGAEAPLIPFKAFGVINYATGSIVAGTAYNATSALSGSLYKVTFTKQLNDDTTGAAMNYVVLLSASNLSGSPFGTTYNSTQNDSFIIGVVGGSAAPLTYISFGVITL